MRFRRHSVPIILLMTFDTLQIRIFPSLEKTLAYAKMIERAGASLVAVHGRTREQKTAKECLADWDAIKVRCSFAHPQIPGVLRTA